MRYTPRDTVAPKDGLGVGANDRIYETRSTDGSAGRSVNVY